MNFHGTGLVCFGFGTTIASSTTRFPCCWVLGFGFWVSRTHVTHFHRFGAVTLVYGGVINGKNLQQNRFLFTRTLKHTHTHTCKWRVVCVKNKWEKRRQKVWIYRVQFENAHFAGTRNTDSNTLHNKYELRVTKNNNFLIISRSQSDVGVVLSCGSRANWFRKSETRDGVAQKQLWSRGPGLRRHF